MQSWQMLVLQRERENKRLRWDKEGEEGTKKGTAQVGKRRQKNEGEHYLDRSTWDRCEEVKGDDRDSEWISTKWRGRNKPAKSVAEDSRQPATTAGWILWTLYLPTGLHWSWWGLPQQVKKQTTHWFVLVFVLLHNYI